MTRKQYEREKLIGLRLEREAELRRLARAQSSADPRYVQSVVDFIWERLVERKLALRDSLPAVEQKRLSTLVELVA